MISPIGVSVCADQRWTCSSDLKNRIVAQVKPMLSHHFAAGTAKCTTPWASTNPIQTLRCAAAAERSRSRVEPLAAADGPVLGAQRGQR